LVAPLAAVGRRGYAGAGRLANERFASAYRQLVGLSVRGAAASAAAWSGTCLARAGMLATDGSVKPGSLTAAGGPDLPGNSEQREQVGRARRYNGNDRPEADDRKRPCTDTRTTAPIFQRTFGRRPNECFPAKARESTKSG